MKKKYVPPEMEIDWFDEDENIIMSSETETTCDIDDCHPSCGAEGDNAQDYSETGWMSNNLSDMIPFYKLF